VVDVATTIVTSVADAMFAGVIAAEYRYILYPVAPAKVVHESDMTKPVVGDTVPMDNTMLIGTTTIDGEFDGAELPVAFTAVTA
jgi:hypothetical protein